MCFIISDKKNYSKERIAKRDIPCNKILLVKEDGKFDGIFNYAVPLYELNVVSYAKDESQEQMDSFRVYIGIHKSEIFTGIHSYSRKRKLKIQWDSESEAIIYCRIPKGTKYYYNPSRKEYVSLAIIPLRVIG